MHARGGCEHRSATLSLSLSLPVLLQAFCSGPECQTPKDLPRLLGSAGGTQKIQNDGLGGQGEAAEP